MIIDFERTGGASGMTLTARIDTKSIPKDEAAELATWLSKLKSQRTDPKPDRFTYTIKVANDDTASRIIKVAELPEYSELLKYLTTKALAKV